MFHRGSLTRRKFPEPSVVEFTAEARLETPGYAIASERTLRRIRLGIAGVVPGVGVGLRIGTMFAAAVGGYTKGVGVGVEFGALGVGVGDEPLAISVWRSPMTRSIALAANSFTFD